MTHFGACLLLLGIRAGEGLHLGASSNSSASGKEGPRCEGTNREGLEGPDQQTKVARAREFLPMLNALPRRTLNKKEVDTLKRDGVVVLRGVVPDRELLQRLKDSVIKEGFEATVDIASGVQPWDTAAVALGLESLLLSNLAASAYEVPGPICVSMAQIFEKAGADPPPPRGGIFHVDRREPTSEMVAIWLSLSDADSPVDYLRGSNHFRREIVGACYRLWPRHPDFTMLRDGCPEEYEKNLTRYLGYPSLWATKMAAGDVLIHDGNVLHRGMTARGYRLALTFRYDLPPGAQRRTDIDGIF